MFHLNRPWAFPPFFSHFAVSVSVVPTQLILDNSTRTTILRVTGQTPLESTYNNTTQKNGK